MHARRSFAIGWWPDGKNGTTWTFKKFLNSLAYLPPPKIIHFQPYWERNLPEFHCSAAALWKECCQHHITTASCLSGLVWKLFGAETTCVPVRTYNPVVNSTLSGMLSLSEHFRSAVKLIIYLGRRCLLFRMACTVLADDRTHTAQKAAAASHIEPCPAQHPKVSKPYITSTHTSKLCCWVTLWVNSSTTKITNKPKSKKR